MPQVISKLSLFEHFLIWATENPLKIWPLSAVLFWQISANIYVCRFIAFFLSSFDHGTFWEVATVVYALYVVVLSWNLKQKGLIQCYAYTNVANRIMFSFVQVLQWLAFLVTIHPPWSDGCKIDVTKLMKPNGTIVPLYCGTGTKKYETDNSYIYNKFKKKQTLF
jgi:hypothetical protein